MPLQSFLEDLFHDVPRYGGVAGRSVTPEVLLPIVLKNGCNVSLLPGPSSDRHEFSKVMGGGLAAALVNSSGLWL